MKIRLKAFSIVGLSSAIIIIITLLILKLMFLGYIEKNEVEIVKHNYERAVSVFQREEESLENTVLDWAQWDDTYQFLEDKNNRYIEVNLQSSPLEALNINFLLYYSIDNKLFYSLSNTNETGAELDSALNNQSMFMDLNQECITGIYNLGGMPVFISAAPVTSSDGEKTPNGYLVMGRYVESTFIKYLQEVLQVDMRIISSEAAEKDKFITFTQHEPVEATFWSDTTKERIVSYKYLKDIHGNNSLVLTQNMKRDDYKNGLKALNYFVLLFFTALLLISFVSIFMMDKMVTNRLKKFHDFMWNVGKTRDTSARISIPGNDEIAELGFLTNNMLQKLDESYEEMRNMNERFRLTLEATNDGYFDANLITKQVYVSFSWMQYLGYDNIKGPVDHSKCLNTIANREDRMKFINTLKRCINKEIDYLRVELRVAKKTGEIVWIVVRGKVVEYDETGVPIRFICTIFDITERKKYEEESIFLSQTDVVTGLKNRAYLEDVMSKTEKYAGDNTWIIMGDVNGLKLINDSFGHAEGDRLLKTIGTILKDCCTKDEIPARWGGDEFVVYVRNKDEEYVQNLMSRITKACERVKDYPIKVSITLGYANREKGVKTWDSVLKRAEEAMYRHKLLESRSTRSNIIASLEQTLNEKHIETMEHTKRIRKMCVKVGNKMGLSHEEMDELVLLGALHDIGKIGIPESILMKSSELTDEEWVIMKKHTEIGYRIATASPELAHIADEILYHHERFDGTGYPHGLSGKEIPKLARIISIVDSFDVMTHDRIYKAAMTVDEAIKELKNCSDKQFDPEIVEQFISSLNLK